MTVWHPFPEHKPPKAGSYLVADLDVDEPCIYSYTKRNGFVDELGRFVWKRTHRITHWMELPPMPNRS